MKKFLCYDTNDAASGKINVSANGMLKPNSTVPSTNGSSYQQLVTDGSGNTKWEDRLAYEGSRVVVDTNGDIRYVRVSDEVPSFASDGASVNVWLIMEGHEIHETMSLNGDALDFFAGKYVFIFSSDNTTIPSGTVFQKKGVYFSEYVGHGYVSGFSSADSDTPEITWDGSIEITKKIDEKFLPDQLILYAPENEDGTGPIQVYKNEDVSNLEHASVEEVQRAFLGRGVFIKLPNGAYVQASAFVPASEMLDNKFFFGVPK